MNLIADETCAADDYIALFGLHEDVMLCAGYIHGHITICNVSDVSVLNGPITICNVSDVSVIHGHITVCNVFDVSGALKF